MTKREVKVQDYLLYEQCPEQYRLFKESNLHIEKVQDAADKAVGQLANYFFSHLMMNKIPSYQTLLNKWEKIWFNNIDISEIIIGSFPTSRNSFIRTNSNVIIGLKHFYEYWQEDHRPILINEKVNITAKNNYMPVTIPIISKNKENDTEIIHIVSSSNVKRLVTEKRKREFKLIQAAFESLSGEKSPIHVYALGSANDEKKNRILKPDNSTLPYVIDKLDSMYTEDYYQTDNCSGCMIKYKCREN